MISPRRSEVIGTWEAGRRTTLFPTARAGATLWATRLSGKLNGVMAVTTPKGKRRTRPQRPAVWGMRSSGIISPPCRLASSAAISKVMAARSVSVRESRMTFPAWRAIERASSSFRALMACEVWARTAARSPLESLRVWPKAFLAAVTASSTWARVAKWTRPMRAWSYGDRTSLTFGDSRHVPPMRSLCSFIAFPPGKTQHNPEADFFQS